MIAMAILNSESKRLLLGDIYKYIMDKYPYYRLEGQGWRNSIRHNLSLNDCFMKAGRAESGKGHYWTVRPDSIAEFKNGGYRRRLRRTCTRGASHAPQETMRPQISISPFLSQLSQLKAEEVQSSSEREPEQSTWEFGNHSNHESSIGNHSNHESSIGNHSNEQEPCWP